MEKAGRFPLKVQRHKKKANPHNHVDFNLAGLCYHYNCCLCTVPSVQALRDPGRQLFLRVIKTGIVFPYNSASLIQVLGVRNSKMIYDQVRWLSYESKLEPITWFIPTTQH